MIDTVIANLQWVQWVAINLLFLCLIYGGYRWMRSGRRPTVPASQRRPDGAASSPQQGPAADKRWLTMNDRVSDGTTDNEPLSVPTKHEEDRQ